MCQTEFPCAGTLPAMLYCIAMSAVQQLSPRSGRWLGYAARMLINFIGSTLRLRLDDPHNALHQVAAQPVIFAFWHNRIFLMPYLFRRLWQARRLHPPAVLVSASRDGARLVTVLEQCGIVCVRGSSSRRGSAALRELARKVRAGHDAGITPDGPRGPRYVVQEGIISLAQLTGAPLLPISWVASRRIEFKSWDGFILPLPWARCVVRVGPPIRVPAGAAARAEKRLELERVLRSLSAP